ncbi:mannosyltransferase [Fictibacillus macauensis ZFHKF-1]|uniref:Mannosyltransferase n=1 Tax=Fictibacillus macauensis ZFHKF-1 TaxID=1196324 RepID=I8AG56_9BACL|nr:glycosyltransferase family 1 protein [Fictibacillus macauensis]EIT84632.1 mannosyltransferase [Fictibacillus macauensis ZFHKF-1]
MKIAFDRAYAITPSSQRGIGRYSEALLYELQQNPSVEIVVFDLMEHWSAEKIKEEIVHFINKEQPDLYLVQSPFDYYGIAPNLAKSWFPNVTLATTVYDFIPFHFPTHFLFNEEWKRRYESIVSFISQCDVVFAISECTKQEVLQRTDLKNEQVRVISGGIDVSFQRAARSKVLLERYGITSPFVLYTGGAEVHKNVPAIIRSFAKATPLLKKSHQLVLAGEIYPHMKLLLEREAARSHITDSLVFTGYVPDDVLIQLYSSADVFLFPSLYEGFGLPVLEAMACGTPVVTSDVASLPEVAGDAAIYVDPTDDECIATGLIDVLQHPERHASLIEKGLQQVKKFSWKQTGNHVVSTCQKITEELW